MLENFVSDWCFVFQLFIYRVAIELKTAHELWKVGERELLSTCFLLYYNSIDMFIGLFCLLRYVGRLYVKSTGKPVDILKKLNELAGFDPDEEIELYEVCSSAIFG